MSHEFSTMRDINNLMNITFNLLDLLAMLDVGSALIPSERAVERFANKRYFRW